jgi:penicillin-binding protein 1A
MTLIELTSAYAGVAGNRFPVEPHAFPAAEEGWLGWLFGEVGGDNVIEAARELGVRSPIEDGDPSVALGTSTMTLMELTAAYAGIAGNDFPVVPTAFVAEEPGWLESLWDGKDSLGGEVHEDLERMLRGAVNRGTGRAAMLSVPNFGKTGTTQDHRDALFVGYAGGLVVGVWVGNDDNTPMPGVTGGGVPARIWKDFMSQALGVRSAPSRPRATTTPDPEGPVQPQDVPELGDIPLGDGANLQIGEDGATISGEIEGVPIDLRIDRNGVQVQPGARNRDREAGDEPPTAVQ